jgi:hypothetical protein
MQISSVGSSPFVYPNNPLASKAKSGTQPQFGRDSTESQAWLWKAAATASKPGTTNGPQAGSKVLMRALISMLEATLGGGSENSAQGPLGSEYPSAFAVVNAQGSHPMNAYLAQRWTQRMRGALQRIAADLAQGAGGNALEQADVQALVTGLASAGPDQANEAAFVRSMLIGLSSVLSGNESSAPGSIISVQA